MTIVAKAILNNFCTEKITALNVPLIGAHFSAEIVSGGKKKFCLLSARGKIRTFRPTNAYQQSHILGTYVFSVQYISMHTCTASMT